MLTSLVTDADPTYVQKPKGKTRSDLLLPGEGGTSNRSYFDLLTWLQYRE